jgi:SAM-dependent methyltransferase
VKPERYQRAIEANRNYFQQYASDFDVIHDDPRKIRNRLTRLATLVYCRDHIHVRLRAIVSLVTGGLAGKRVCELGCGPGRYALHYHSLGAKVVGVDYAPEMLRLAEDRCGSAGVPGEECRFVENDVLAFDDAEKFDVVIASGLIDYLPNELGARLVRHMADLCREGGQVIITYPFKGGLFNTVRRCLRRAQNVHTFYYELEEIRQAFADSGLAVTGRTDIVGYWIFAATRTGGGCR